MLPELPSKEHPHTSRTNAGIVRVAVGLTCQSCDTTKFEFVNNNEFISSTAHEQNDVPALAIAVHINKLRSIRVNIIVLHKIFCMNCNNCSWSVRHRNGYKYKYKYKILV